MRELAVLCRAVNQRRADGGWREPSTVVMNVERIQPHAKRASMTERRQIGSQAVSSDVGRNLTCTSECTVTTSYPLAAVPGESSPSMSGINLSPLLLLLLLLLPLPLSVTLSQFRT